MNGFFVSIFCIFLLPINSLASDFTLHEEYWVQVFAATDEESVERFLLAHSDFSAHKIIKEDGLDKVLVGPHQSYSLAKKSREYNNVKGAFVRVSKKPSSSNKNITTTANDYELAKNTTTLQYDQHNNPDNNTLIAKVISIFTNNEKQNTKSHTFIDFVETAENNEIFHFNETPWGNNYDVMAQETYFAASGRQCRKLILFRQDERLPEMKTICKYAGSNWEKALSIKNY